jgi:formylglycine-generating enzyme required for sulfatase activity
MDPGALNYNPDAEVDDERCVYPRDIPDGFTALGPNAQGYQEYKHDQTDIVFVLLPGGEFEMGSPENEPNRYDDEGLHTVTLSPFLIAKYEVTQPQYEAVIGGHPLISPTPSEFWGRVDSNGDPINPPFDRDQMPVQGVSWRNTQVFAERTGLRLPSEAQWEYAARGGIIRTAFSFGDGCLVRSNARNCDSCATADEFMWWCGNDAPPIPRPVGTKLPNRFGLHDMHGNVYEWCEDVYDADFYESEAAAGLDPVSTSGSPLRVLRGGSWHSYPLECRSANRWKAQPTYRPGIGIIGFRPAMSIYWHVPGCTDPEADNYDVEASVDDGTCEFLGCMDPEAQNFNSEANVDDGTCCYSEVGCIDLDGFTYLGENDQGNEEYRQVATDIVFVLLPGGEFQMGSPVEEAGRNDDEGLHTVTLSPFLIAKYEVTQDEWVAVMGANPSYFDGTIDRGGDAIAPPLDRDQLPVEQVSWDDIQAFEALTGLQLPTEAQWEYACRAGQAGPYSGTGNLDEMGWYSDNSELTTHPVGTKEANQFGLYDMHGNVYEWCEDVFDEDFYESEAVAGLDPVADSGSESRVARGGGWRHDRMRCRSARRSDFRPSLRGGSLGFRPVRSSP